MLEGMTKRRMLKPLFRDLREQRRAPELIVLARRHEDRASRLLDADGEVVDARTGRLQRTKKRGRLPVRAVSAARALASFGRSTVSITSKFATASFTLLVC